MALKTFCARKIQSGGVGRRILRPVPPRAKNSRPSHERTRQKFDLGPTPLGAPRRPASAAIITGPACGPCGARRIQASRITEIPLPYPICSYLAVKEGGGTFPRPLSFRRLRAWGPSASRGKEKRPRGVERKEHDNFALQKAPTFTRPATTLLAVSEIKEWFIPEGFPRPRRPLKRLGWGHEPSPLFSENVGDPSSE